jgi:hypothetical protein
VSQLTFWALLLAIAGVAVYLTVAVKCKKKPDLAVAVNIMFTTVGTAGGIRLIGFVFTPQFTRLSKEFSEAAWWSLSPEDATFIFVGGLSLIWISCQTIVQIFRDLISTNP